MEHEYDGSVNKMEKIEKASERQHHEEWLEYRVME